MTFTAEELAAARDAHKSRLRMAKYLDGLDGLSPVYALTGMDPRRASPREHRTVEIIRDQIRGACEVATSIAVPEDMCRMVDAHWTSYPSLRIDPGDTVLPFGWAHFELPIPDPVAPNTPPLRSLMWWTHPLAVVPGHEGADDDEYAITMIGMCDSRHLKGANERNLSHLPRVMPWTSLVWRLGREDGALDGDTRALRRHFGAPHVKVLSTLWSLIRQRMLDTEAVHRVMPREYADWARKKDREVNPALKVVRLSRTSPTTYEYLGPNRPEWAWQWWVRAHWRMQWFPKLETHKPRLILPHIKGPWDAPLKGDERMLLPPRPRADHG